MKRKFADLSFLLLSCYTLISIGLMLYNLPEAPRPVAGTGTFEPIFTLPDKGFDKIKHLISRHESAGNVYKVRGNKNGTVDCGTYHVNSIHFMSKGDSISNMMDLVFERYGVGSSVHERVAASIMNDELNEIQARIVFHVQGLKAWVSHRKVLKDQRKEKP